jgi:DNA-binding transcriptional MerR regulator
MASGAMDKSPDAFRTISEVAEDLDLPQHVLRFWETRFPHIRPLKRGGGRRYYRPDDIDLLKGIRHLLYGEGYTIKGVQRILKSEGIRFVQAVGRGEQSVAAPRDDQPAFELGAEVVPDDAEKVLPAAAALHRPAAKASLSPSTLQNLQTALRELVECDRVLAALRAPSETTLGE